MATGFTGIATAYDLTVGAKVNMDEVIYTIDPIDAPLSGGIGSDGLSIIASAPLDQITFSWMHESILTPRSLSVGALTTGDTVLTVTAADRTKFTTGDVLRISGTTELIQIASYGTTADTFTITRGFAGTTAATLASGSTLIGLGVALAEGSDPNAGRNKDRDSFSNNTQIFGPYQQSVSGTEQVVTKYGVTDEFSRQLFNRTNELVIAREQAYIYGRKFNSTTTKVRTMGGLDEFITTVTDATNTQITVSKLQGNLQTNYLNGGVPDRLACNPLATVDLNDIGNTSVVRQTIDDPRRGRVPVMSVYTEFGEITILRHRWIYKAHAFAWKRDGVVRRVLRPYFMQPLAITGDSKKVMYLVEESLEVKGEPHMHKMTNLTAY